MMFETKYRVSRDAYLPIMCWAVQKKAWWWPFWVETECNCLMSKQEAYDMIQILKDVR